MIGNVYFPVHLLTFINVIAENLLMVEN